LTFQDRRQSYLIASFVCAVAAVVAWQVVSVTAAGLPTVAVFIGLALYFRSYAMLKGLSFTAALLGCAIFALFYPEPFLSWNGFKPTRLLVPAIQVIMFGMGASVSMADFARVLRMPVPVFIGVFLQFSVMPLLGASIAWGFGFEPEVAAGIVLVGSCSGGVASNVITYLARANVPLSVTLTACSTMLAPLMTPIWMKVLAGRLVPVDFFEMMASIVKMIILPILAGAVVNRLIHGRKEWIDRVLPLLAMATICGINTIVTANSRDRLLTIGAALVAAVLLHNIAGYALGYGSARIFGLSTTDCRTVAIEVGMQNGGMAIGLAFDVLKSAQAALAPTVFGTFMNATGSALASWWSGRPALDVAADMPPLYVPRPNDAN
jgi:bile acid:Na+ symporter, BASS family